MRDFLLSTPAQIVIWLAVLAILVMVGGYIMGSFRGRADEVRPSANELLTNFREMHERGDIADMEFRNIKTVLGEKLEQELNVSVGGGSEQKSESTGNTHHAGDSADSET